MESSIEIVGSDLHMTRSGETWAITGRDEGPADAPKGSFWIEMERLVYVDANGRKRVIVLETMGNTTRPTGYLAMHPRQWLWYSAGDGRQVGIVHSDQSSQDWNDHSNTPAHSDTSHSDRPSHSDYIDHSDHMDHSDSYSDHVNHTHLDLPHEDYSDSYSDHVNNTHLDSPHGDYSDSYSDHVNNAHSDHSNQSYQDWPHGDRAHYNWSDHSNQSYQDWPHGDRAHYNWSDHGDGGGHADENVRDRHSDHSDRGTWLHADYSDYLDAVHGDSPRRI